jgi:hypothetical protein
LTPACDTNGHSFGATLASGGHKAWLADSNYTVNFDMGTTTQAMWSSGTGINAYWADTTEIWAKSIRFLKVTEDLTKNEPPGSTNRVKTPALFTRFSLSSLSILLCRPRYIFFKQTVMDPQCSLGFLESLRTRWRNKKTLHASAGKGMRPSNIKIHEQI